MSIRSPLYVRGNDGRISFLRVIASSLVLLIALWLAATMWVVADLAWLEEGEGSGLQRPAAIVMAVGGVIAAAGIARTGRGVFMALGAGLVCAASFGLFLVAP